MSLGATPGSILVLVLRRGLSLTATGLAISIAGSLALGGLLKSLLYGVDAQSPATLLLVSLVLLSIAGLACWLPARRAARVDPVIALRNE